MPLLIKGFSPPEDHRHVLHLIKRDELEQYFFQSTELKEKGFVLQTPANAVTFRPPRVFYKFSDLLDFLSLINLIDNYEDLSKKETVIQIFFVLLAWCYFRNFIPYLTEEEGMEKINLLIRRVSVLGMNDSQFNFLYSNNNIESILTAFRILGFRDIHDTDDLTEKKTEVTHNKLLKFLFSISIEMQAIINALPR